MLVAALAVQAQDEHPLRPEDAYRYVVSDTGDALEVDWAIEDEYYLYRNELSFESHHDGRDTEQATSARWRATRRRVLRQATGIPREFLRQYSLSVDGDSPETVELVIKSRGCWDGGICYPPQTWTETVTLKQAKAELTSWALAAPLPAAMMEISCRLKKCFSRISLSSTAIRSRSA